MKGWEIKKLGEACKVIAGQSPEGKFYNADEKGLPFYKVRSIIEDKTGNIWIGSADGLCRYDPSASLGSGGKPYTNFTNAAYCIFEDKHRIK